MTPGPTIQFPWTPDPVVPYPTDEQVRALVLREGSRAPQVLREMEKKRKQLISGRDTDAYRYGHVPEKWKETEALLKQAVFLVIFGANRSTKTWFTCWAAMRHCITDPKANVLFLHNDEAQSIDVHQAIFAHFLPLEWKPAIGKRTRAGDNANLSYHPRTGFANGTVILGNGAKVKFGNYGQDPRRFEGAGYTLIIASEKFPLTLMNTLAYRLPGAGQTLTTVWDYTPLDGITPGIAQVLNGAQTVASEPAIHLPPDYRASEHQDWPVGHMPRHQLGVEPGTHIVYVWSEDNKLGGGEALRKLMVDKKWDIPTIEKRMYGYARNVTGKALPKFTKANIVPLAKLKTMGLLTERSTRRFIYDPAGARNPFMCWMAADENDRHCTYREWPDRPRFGEWAVQSSNENKWNGDTGPAQLKIGLSIVEQKKLILEAEGWEWSGKEWKPGPRYEEIYERIIDPRAAVAKRQTENEDDADTLADLFAEEQTDTEGNIIGPAMEFTVASGISIEAGLEVMNGKYLAYDMAQPIVPLLNEPRWYVAEECEQTIFSALNWRPRTKLDEACKDPLDCARYYFVGSPTWEDAGAPAFHKGRGFRK
jgi:hypothetical protein